MLLFYVVCLSSMLWDRRHSGSERAVNIDFRQLGLPEPDINLGVGSGIARAQTAADHDRPGGSC